MSDQKNNANPAGGTPDFKWQGWGRKSNLKKFLGLQTKPPKNPRTKNPPKIPYRISEPFIRGTRAGYVGTITNLLIVLNTPKKSLLKSSYPQKIITKIFQPPKIPRSSSLSLEIRSNPLETQTACESVKTKVKRLLGPNPLACFSAYFFTLHKQFFSILNKTLL